MKSTWELHRRILATMGVILTILLLALLLDVESAGAWAIVGAATTTAGAVLLHLTRPVPQTTSQTIHEARR